MDTATVDTILLHVRESLEHSDVPEAIRIIEALLPADQADVFEEVEPERQGILLPYWPPRTPPTSSRSSRMRRRPNSPPGWTTAPSRRSWPTWSPTSPPTCWAT